MSTEKIPFNRPYAVGTELHEVEQAISNGHLSGNGPYTKRCTDWLESRTLASRAILTHSCTGALEIAALLAEITCGDEVILPSFTFSSTANAFVLRGATPVFVDVREDTLNLDPGEVRKALGPKTRAIVAVHYGGIVELDELSQIAAEAGVWLIEDAAQGLLATYRDRELGTFGRLGALSFHETKNVISGEGGALLINDPDLVERAEIILEKGTDRSRFSRGEVDKYTWHDVGGSYALSEILAAFLWTQLEAALEITARRLEIWHAYHDALQPLEQERLLTLPVVPEDVTHNGHMYYVLLASRSNRDRFIAQLAESGVHAVSHYVPLHSSPAGLRFGRSVGDLPVTISAGDRLVRLPIWTGMRGEQIERVVDSVTEAIATLTPMR